MSWGIKLISTELSRLGLCAPADLECRLKALINSENVDSVLDQEVSSLEVARAWKLILDSKKIDRLAWIGLLLVIRKHFSSSNPSLHTALYENFGLGWLGSKIQLELRLGGFLFDEARGKIKQIDQRESARKLLEESVTSFDFLEKHDERLKQVQKIIYRGKRGVCRLMLARGEARGDISNASYIQQLEDSYRDLEQAGKYGDHSPQHYEYILETVSRIYDRTKEPHKNKLRNFLNLQLRKKIA
jgi:hypothetical protein